MKVEICDFGSAPEQKKDGYKSLGIEVRGTDESIKHTFKSTGDVRLIRSGSIYGTNEHVFFVMVKEDQEDITPEPRYVAIRGFESEEDYTTNKFTTIDNITEEEWEGENSMAIINENEPHYYQIQVVSKEGKLLYDE